MLAYGPELFEGCPRVTPDILWRPGPFQSTNAIPPSQHPSKVIDPSLTFTNFGLRISAVLFRCKPCEHMYDPYNPYYEVSFLGRNYYIASPLRKDTDRTPQLFLAVLGSFKRPIGDSFFAEEEVLSLVLLQKVGSYWMPTYRRVPVEIPPHLASMYRIFLEDAVPETIFVV
ncbi:hypothetical protein ONZ45_g18028 [Pleurotus djamor]|nr:hypothetical protein ONZ45_g18028 [Pleurotus djamor]